jgi:hypothetical protein
MIRLWPASLGPPRDHRRRCDDDKAREIQVASFETNFVFNPSRRGGGCCELARPVDQVVDPLLARNCLRGGGPKLYAVLRLNSFDPAKLGASGEKLEEFDRIHAAQPGYVGSIVVDLGESRRFALNLWESEQHSTSALSVLGPEVQRLLVPLLSSPSELIGVGTVLSSDLAPSTDGR